MDQHTPEKVAGELPALLVRSTSIVNAQTLVPVRLRGVNRSGFEYTPSPIVPEAELDRITRWGANILRLPFNQAWALDSAAYRLAIDTLIEAASSRGLYTLLDLQWLDAENSLGRLADGSANFVPPLPDCNSVHLWRTLAARYRSNPAVLYDIFNEPHDPLADDPYGLTGVRSDGSFFELKTRRVTQREWHPWASHLIHTIRSEHPSALIFVSGLDWAYDLSHFPIDGVDNVVYSTHVYPSKKKSWDRAFGRLARTHPVFVGECGGTENDLTWGEELLSYLDQRQIGWTAWSWCDQPHLIQPGSNAEPTPFGRLVQASLGQPSEPHPSLTV
jgi:endoglucanase